MPEKDKNPVASLVAGLTSEDATACNQILDRLKLVANVKSDTALAKVMGLRQSSISTAKTRAMVPTAWIINAAKLFEVSADWLIFGEERVPNQSSQTSLPCNSNSVEITKKNDVKAASQDDSLKDELLTAYKEIHELHKDNKKLKEDNEQLKKEIAKWEKHDASIKEELLRKIMQKEAEDLIKTLAGATLKAKEDEIDLSSESEEELAVARNYWEDIKAGVINKP